MGEVVIGKRCPGLINMLNQGVNQSDLASKRAPARLPERILQFGEGNFLRGFADWMVDKLNQQGLFGGSVVVVQPVRQGLVDVLQSQRGLYTLLLRGIQGGQLVESREVIGSISRALNPYPQWAEVVAVACSADLRFVFSNTTEAGIAYVSEPLVPGTCPDSFPAKVAALLYERYQAVHGDPTKGLVFLPCELIDRNGAKLKEYVLKHAAAWKLEPAFSEWVNTANYFLNTLVDRIVPGYPKEEAAGLTAELGYEDKLMVAGEIFHLWVIEGPQHLAEEIPFHRAGLNVVWTGDMTPYRTRKVRVLNGAHTASVLGAFLAGLNTVGEMMKDRSFGPFVRQAVFDEILPTLKMDEADRRKYAEAVLERFSNPFIKHELLSISLNSVSKWKVRVLPALHDYVEASGKLPPALTFSLAALIRFYDGTPVAERELRGQRNGEPYPIRDDAEVLAFFAVQWQAYHATGNLRVLVQTVLGHAAFWGRDLTEIRNLGPVVEQYLGNLLQGKLLPPPPGGGSPETPVLLQIDPGDNVAVALDDIAAGRALAVSGLPIKARREIPRGHKLALRDLAVGENVVKYGHPIGHVTQPVAAGDWVHVHNLKTNLSGTEAYTYQPEVSPRPASANVAATFKGFVRSDGEVGIRNELWILPTVGCVNHTAQSLAQEFRARVPEGSVSGVYAFTHPYGCSQLGEDHENTRKILADLARHPNAGGVLVVGLGCENNTMAEFKRLLGDVDPARYRFLVVQEVEDEIATGLHLLGELAAHVGRAVRQPVSAAKLRVGLKCGGSDAFSGITANPLVGAFSDRLIACGGATVLTEVPEMFGAETILMKRCPERATFDACVKMINGFKEYFLRHNQVVYENPSPGNKDGGISTLEEKSLGCTQKGGHSPVVDVLDYGARLRRPGLNLLNGPGNDIVACTALAAAGAHLVLFTTGRGTPLGAPAPTVKVASNTALATRKRQWIDFDAGQLLAGVSMDDLAGRLFDRVLAIASGEVETRSEINGHREIAIFKDGVTL
jgi:altronate hydrolase